MPGTLAIFLGSAEQRVQLGRSTQKLEKKIVNGGKMDKLTYKSGWLHFIHFS